MIDHWEAALIDLRAQLSAENYDTWLAPLRYDHCDGKTLRLRIPNRFYADWIRTHYLDLLLESLRTHGAVDELDVTFVVDPSLADQEATNTTRNTAANSSKPASERREESADNDGANSSARDGSVEPAAQRISGMAPRPSSSSQAPGGHRPATNLNPKYRFESFVVGPSNQLAHAAAAAAASSPGTRYNPLFFYGGVGLGKTHLVNAIGHRVLQDRPDARILYVSAERFTNEFIWSLQNHRINDFRDRYRNNCDVLLMDDIQFLASREQTQEEFFHTFNALYHSDRQIVVSSDAYPQQIGRMEERLVSRFQWGMVADIQAPELDTRIAIVRKKAELEGIEIDAEVAQLLAQTVKSNVRELEGTLLQLAVKADLQKRPIDLQFARDALQAHRPAPNQLTTVEEIQRAVCEYFNIRMSDLKSHRRHRSVSHPRMVAMYLARQRLQTSYGELGERFGGKDHTTVMSAVRKIEGRIDSDDRELIDSLEAIERKLSRG
ncbi:MAG: chromosomal replication initiator protein DnaA [Myxococcales bacterium]|nr:chromosomal replication initiator protein DnaA [Myxococcales bacterium]